jgi:hypothetical protein
MLTGLTFGAAFLTSAPAIVAFLLLPTIWDVVVGRVNSLADVAAWLDSAHTLAPLTLQPLSALEWEHVATTLALWIGVPLLAESAAATSTEWLEPMLSGSDSGDLVMAEWRERRRQRLLDLVPRAV